MSGFQQHKDGGRVIPNARKFHFENWRGLWENYVPDGKKSPAEYKAEMFGFPDKRTVKESGVLSDEEYRMIADIYKSFKNPNSRIHQLGFLLKKDRYLLPAYALFAKVFNDSLIYALDNRDTFGHDGEFVQNWAKTYREKYRELSNPEKVAENLIAVLKAWGERDGQYSPERYDPNNIVYLCTSIPKLAQSWLEKAQFLLSEEQTRAFVRGGMEQTEPLVQVSQPLSLAELREGFEKLIKSGDKRKHAAQYMKKMLAQMKHEIPEQHLDDFSEYNFVRKNHTFESMRAEFGIGAVQWGSNISKNHKEQQALLNRSAQTFSEIAMLLNVPRRAMGLGDVWGEEDGLGLAFASQGKRGALAFYNAPEHFLHLNRKHSEGATVHEWFHALDRTLGIAFHDHFIGKEVKGLDNQNPMFSLYYEKSLYFPEVAKAMKEYAPEITSLFDILFKGEGLRQEINQDNIGEVLKEFEDRSLIIRSELKSKVANEFGQALSAYIPHLKNLQFWEIRLQEAQEGKVLQTTEHNTNIIRNSVNALFSQEHPLYTLLADCRIEEKKEYGVMKNYCIFDNGTEQFSLFQGMVSELGQTLSDLKEGKAEKILDNALAKIDTLTTQAKDEWLPVFIEQCVSKRFAEKQTVKEAELMRYAFEHFNRFFQPDKKDLQGGEDLESQVSWRVGYNWLHSSRSQAVELLFPQILQEMCQKGYRIETELKEHPLITRSKELDAQLGPKPYYGTYEEVFARLGEALVFYAGRNKNLFNCNIEQSPQYLKPHECGDFMDRLKKGLNRCLGAEFDLNPDDFKRNTPEKPEQTREIPQKPLSVQAKLF